MNFNRQGALLNAVMIVALTASVSGVVRRFVPAWQPGYLVAACFLIALEVSFVQHIMRTERMWLGELARYLVPEIMVMLVIMRVAATMSFGGVGLVSDAYRWLYDPLSIFDSLFVSFIFVGLIVGGLSHVSLRDLAELAPQPFEQPTELSQGHRRYIVIVAGERAAALRRISGRFIAGGVLLLCALGLEAVNIQRIAGPSQPISALSAAGALVYLVSGLLLYSQARLALLQSRWRLDGARVAEGVSRRWTRASWLLIALVATAALVLPRGYGLGLLDTMWGIFGLLSYVIALLSYLVLWLVTLLMFIPAWILSLFPTPAGGGAPPQPFVPPPRPPPAVYQPNLPAALVFWACMLGLTGYAIWIVVQRHPWLFQSLARHGPWTWVLRRFGWLWRDTRSWAGQVAEAVQQLLRWPAVAARPRMPSLRLRRLAPRDLVRYFYRSTLRRAAARGISRRAGQTPYEYGATLGERLPEAHQDISELTEAFVVAQYSPRPVGPDEARQARRPWERLRRRLRAARERRGALTSALPPSDDASPALTPQAESNRRSSDAHEQT